MAMKMRHAIECLFLILSLVERTTIRGQLEQGNCNFDQPKKKNHVQHLYSSIVSFFLWSFIFHCGVKLWNTVYGHKHLLEWLMVYLQDSFEVHVLGIFGLEWIRCYDTLANNIIELHDVSKEVSMPIRFDPPLVLPKIRISLVSLVF